MPCARLPGAAHETLLRPEIPSRISAHPSQHGCCPPPGSRPDYRCCRRRSKRHCHLLASWRAMALWSGVDAVADHAADDWYSDALRPHRLGHRPGAGCQYGDAVPTLAHAQPDCAAGGGQHHQYCGGHWSHGRGSAPDRRRLARAVQPAVWRSVPAGSGIFLI